MTGSGILNDPYLIETVSDWSEISTHAANSYYYKLVNDLDFSGSAITPISSFSGYIDGNYKRLKYFVITTTEDNSGLFGLITSSNAEYNIKNLEIYSGSVHTTKTYNFGYVAGKLENAKISNVHIVSCSNHIDNEFNGVVDGGFGFFAGHIVSSSILSSSVKYGHYDFYDSFIYNTAYNFGGFVGRVDNSTIIDSFSDVNIYNVQNDLNPINLGGFVGYVDGGDTEILNCHAGNYITIDVNSSSDYVIGGFAGYVNNCNLFENCYSNIWFNQDAPIGTYFNGFAGYSVNDNYNNCFFNLDRALSGQNSSYCVISGRSDKQSNSIVRLNDAEMKSLENYTEIDNYYLTFNGSDTIGFDKTDSVLPDPYFDDKNGSNWEVVEGTATFGSIEVGQQGDFCVALKGQTSILTVELTSMLSNVEYIAKIRYKSTGTITIADSNDVVYKQLSPKGNWDYTEFYFTSSTSVTQKIKISIPSSSIAWIDSLYIVENTRADFDSVNILDDDIYNKVLELNGTGEQLYTESQPDLAVFNISSLSGTQLPTNYAVKAGATTEIVTTEIGSSKCLKVVLTSSPSGLYRNYTLSANSSYKARIKYKSTASINFTSWNGFSETFYVLPATTEWNELEFTFNTTQVASEIYFRLNVVSTFFIEYFEIYEDVKNELNLNNEIIKHSKNKKFELSTKDNILVNSGYSGTTDWVDTNNDGLADYYSDQYAIEFDGVDDYLQINLPSDVTSSLFVPSTAAGGNPPTHWIKYGSVGSSTISYSTVESGSSGCLKIVFNSSDTNGIYSRFNLTAGKKYKFNIRYKSTANILIGAFTISNSYYTGLNATSQWNSVVRTIIAPSGGSVPIWLWCSTNGATLLIESISIIEDWKLDLNESYELIKHSINRDFEQTLGAEIATGTVTIGKKYIVTAGTVEGNAVGTEFLAVTNATTLDANNKVKEIPNLVTNGTFTGDANSWGLNDLGTYNSNAVDIVGPSISDMYCYSYTFLTGKRYRVSVQIVAYTSGELYGKFGSTGIPFAFGTTTTGVVSADYTVTVGGLFYFDNSTTLIGTIDNIHIYEIPDYTSTGNHSYTYSTADKYAGTGSLKITATGAGSSGSNYVSLPSAQIDTLVAGNKYTLEGFARLDPASLTYGANLIPTASSTFDTDGTAYWKVTGAAKSWVNVGGADNCIKITSDASGYFRLDKLDVSSNNKKITFRARSQNGFTGKLNYGWAGTPVIFPTVNPNLTADWQNYEVYISNGLPHYIISFLATAAGQEIEIDNISVQESPPVYLTAQIGTKYVTPSYLSIVTGTFTKFVLNFLWEAADVTAGQDLKLYLNGAGSVYVDNVSLTQAYDLIVSHKSKSLNVSTYSPLLAIGGLPSIIGSSEAGCWDFALNSAGQIYYGARDMDRIGMAYRTNFNAVAYHSNYDYIMLFDRANNTQKLYFNGIEQSQILSGVLPNLVGKVTISKAANIGFYSIYYFGGYIGPIQAMRFTNINQSNFNPTLYKIGDSITGGGNEVVLYIDPNKDRTSLNTAIRDWSANNLAVTASGGMTLDNIVRVYGLGRNAEIGFTLNGSNQSLQINRTSELITSNADMNSATNTFWTTSGTVTFGDTSELERLNGVCKIVGSTGQGLRKDSLLTVGKKYFIRMRYKSTVDINFGNTSTVTAYKVFKSTSQWNTIEFSFTAVTNSNIVLYLAASGTAWIDNISIIQDLKFDLNDYERIIHSKNSTGDITTANSGSQTILDEYAISFNGTDEYLYRPLPTDIASFNISGLAHGSTSLPTGWSTVGSGATTVISTTEVGSPKCLICTMPAYSGIRYAALYLTNGKKYKFTIKYKQVGSSELIFGQNNGGYRYYLPQTTQWNTKVLTGIGVDVNNGYFLIYNNSSTACTVYIESITIVEDWKLDLNESYELIKHSMNRDFEISYSSSMMSNTGYSGTTDWTNPDYDGLASSITGSNNYVLDFNGTDEYLYRSLPVNLLANGTFETGVNTDSWSTDGAWTWNDTELGKTGNYCAKVVGSSQAQMYKNNFLTVGKKYKLSMRYKANDTVSLRDGRDGTIIKTFPATSQWNQVYYTFTATTVNFSLRAYATTVWYDDISITEDWKLDLNESYELIKHSMNRDFEQTLGNNLITNGVNWTDSNGDGLANDWTTGGLALAPSNLTGMVTSSGWDTFVADGVNVITASTSTAGAYMRTGNPTDMYLVAGTYRISFDLTVNTGGGGYRWRLSSSPSLGSAIGTDQTYNSTGTYSYTASIAADGTYYWGVTRTAGTLNFSLTNASIRLESTSSAETFSIISGSGWTGNAQRVYNPSGSTSIKHTGSLYSSGSKYIISGLYRSSDSLKIFKNNLEYYTELPTNSGSYIKPFSTEVMLSDNSWFFGVSGSSTTSTWFELDNITVNNIPNLIPTSSNISSYFTYIRSSATYNSVSDDTTVTALDVSGETRMQILVGFNKRYRITFQAKSATLSGMDKIYPNTNSNTIIKNPPLSNIYQWYEYEIGTTINNYIQIVFLLTFNGQTIDFDNFHMYEIPDYVDSGNHTASVSLSDKYAGIGSLLITSTGTGSTGSNYIGLPSAQLDTLVSGNKYTLEGFAKIDPTSLTYGSNACTNGTDWTDTTPANGIPDGWTLNVGTETFSFLNESGNNYLRMNRTHAFGGIYWSGLTTNKIYRVSYRVRGTAPYRTHGESYSVVTHPIPSSTTEWETVIDYVRVVGTLLLIGFDNAAVGTYIDIDDVTIQEATIAPIITAQIGTKSATSAVLNPTSWVKFASTFEASATEVGQDLKVYTNGTASIYLDRISVTQSYDWYMRYGMKSITQLYPSLKMIMYIGSTSFTIPGIMVFRTNGTSLTTHVMSGPDGSTYALNNSSLGNGTISENIWYDIGLLVDNSACKTYTNGVLQTTQTRKVGKITLTDKIAIPYEYPSWNGNFSSIQIIRFTNISQSNFDPTTYKIGDRPTGGGAESVLYYNWKGNTDAEMISDKSGNNNHLTSSNITLALDRFPLNRYDGNASSFISNAAITSSQQRYAVDLLVKDLKTYNLWDKMTAVYPFVGANSSSHALNLKNPLNTDAAFRITWTGNVTHSSSGIKSDGSGYGDTKFNPVVQSSSLTDFSFGVYKKGTEANGTTRIYMGSQASSTLQTFIGWANTGTTEIGAIANSAAPNEYAPTASIANLQTDGFILINVSGSREQQFWTTGSKDGATVISTGTYPSQSMYILTANLNGTAASFTSNTTISFAYIGKGLSDTDAVNLTSIVNRYQNNLGRL